MKVFTRLLAAAGLATGLLHSSLAVTQELTLDNVIAARSAEDRARDVYRHPAETLEFFQVAPGMTVAEVLPSGGWYTRILAPYLGSDATLYGINYAPRMWPMFQRGEVWERERLAATKAFAGDVASYTDNGIKAKGFSFADIPPGIADSVDRVLVIRALHNLNRFEEQAGTLTQALASIRAMLKADGLVGVVQHRLPESAPEPGSDGSRGYLKPSTVIAAFNAAGFTLVGSSEINANPKDQPGPEDVVWRLPPSYAGSEDDPQRRAAMDAIGESDRMTMLFRKAD
ncbi:class I SAM-dependent methyltransferase [Haliea sp. E17]|uniref:class I SAM-dependent methyltransferase n=1 Tax=Haliea sp. E17 TaxID=3401576 RepID=UPI003AAA8281